MKDLLRQKILQHHPPFSDTALTAGLEFFITKTYPAKTTILPIGKVCDYLFLAEQSLSRCFFYDTAGVEQTVWIKPEQMFFTEYKSFVSQQPALFGLQFYEETVAHAIHRRDLLHLYQNYPDWALFGIHLTEHLHVNLIDVFVTLQTNDATKNYQYIEYAFPRFLQVAPLKDIASMLQMSPVSLSRIRAGKQKK